MTKFSDDTCERLWKYTLDGFHDDECGDSSQDVWFGLILNLTHVGFTAEERGQFGSAIVWETEQGFVDYRLLTSVREAQELFDELCASRETEAWVLS